MGESVVGRNKWNKRKGCIAEWNKLQHEEEILIYTTIQY
jgi:hypothetical protein